MSHWYDPLRGLASLGSQTPKATSLAGLHAARQAHLGQFFTPDRVASFMWNLISTQLDAAIGDGRNGKASVLDTSVGSGRLLQFCDPAKHIVGGMDVDGTVLTEVARVCEEAGFSCLFENGCMGDIRPRGWSVALINPPYSLRLDTPLLDPLPSTTYGRFGPNTSAQTDYYAVAQALAGCNAVVALVPRTVAKAVWAEPSLVDVDAEESPQGDCGASRLHARFDLPAATFESEGASVETSVLVFGKKVLPAQLRRHKATTVSEVHILPDLGIEARSSPRLKCRKVDDSVPSITIPVTGIDEVRLAHDGRKIKLKFACGFTLARVMNAILRFRIHNTPTHRLPAGYNFAGQGILDIEVHLLQDDPLQSLQSLIALIERQHATVTVAKGFWEYVKRRVRRHVLSSTPLAHTVWRRAVATSQLTARCRKIYLLNPGSWFSPVIQKDQLVTFTRTSAEQFEATVEGQTLNLTFEQLNEHFEDTSTLDQGGWVRVHEGLASVKPQVAKWWQHRITRSGVSRFLTWDFQLADLLELLMSPTGVVAGWTMGLGKSRLAIAAILASGVKHGLVTTEAYLVPEFVEKLQELDLPAESWQVIGREEQLRDLRQINIISVDRLKMTLPGQRRVTYAHRLRRRVGLVISDEGEFLSNPLSQQSVAVWRVCGKRKWVLSGTPVPNYPRDILPILSYVAGDATAAQPVGYRGAFLEKTFVASVEFAERGIKYFIDNFVSLCWVTNLFADTLREGAKREIPRLNNLPGYRALLAPHVKRRLEDEPDVARYVTIPKPKNIVHTIDWDNDHLAYYLTVADEFSTWFANQRETRKNQSLLMILLRFQAVVRALNIPQDPAKHVCTAYTGLTSKQRFIVKRLSELAAGGHKTLCYVHTPSYAQLLARQLSRQHGIDPLVLHGGIPISKRHKLLRERFKDGDCPTVVATFGVVQAGHNIPQADRIIVGSRDWTAKVERQAIRRALRPETKHEVIVEYPHIRGGADIYQDQMVAMKGDAADAGLDWGTPQYEDTEFLHLDTILGQFCENLAARLGLTRHELREHLVLAPEKELCK